MSTFKGTPGPWEAHEIAPEDPQWGACEIWPANGDRPVATMVCGVDNARLIAAAPELLDALESLLAKVECGTALECDLCDQARAAIARCRGGES